MHTQWLKNWSHLQFTKSNARHIALTAARWFVLICTKFSRLFKAQKKLSHSPFGCINILATIVVLEPEAKVSLWCLLKFSQLPKTLCTTKIPILHQGDFANKTSLSVEMFVQIKNPHCLVKFCNTRLPCLFTFLSIIFGDKPSPSGCFCTTNKSPSPPCRGVCATTLVTQSLPLLWPCHATARAQWT